MLFFTNELLNYFFILISFFSIDGGAEDWAYRIILLTTGIIVGELLLKYVYVEYGEDDDREKDLKKLTRKFSIFIGLTSLRKYLKNKKKNKFMLLDEFFINILAFSCELDLSLILDLFSSDSDSVEIPENSGGGARHDEDPENAIKVILTMLLTFLIFGLMFDDMYLSYLEDKKKKMKGELIVRSGLLT